MLLILLREQQLWFILRFYFDKGGKELPISNLGRDIRVIQTKYFKRPNYYYADCALILKKVTEVI